MEIFFYQSSLEVPFAIPYSREFFTDKQVLLISNKSEIIDEFETHRVAIMEDGITKIIGTKVFVPVAVKAIFLTWLKAEYSTIHWQAKTEFADFRPEVTDELQAFFQQLRIVEKWEGGTMQPDPTKKVEQDENKFAAAAEDASNKYIFHKVVVLIFVPSLLFLLSSLNSSEKIIQSQIDYALNVASKSEPSNNTLYCDLLTRLFTKAEIEGHRERYTKVCQTTNTVLASSPLPLGESALREKLAGYFGQAKLIIEEKSKNYTFVESTQSETGSALWSAKQMWELPLKDNTEKINNVTEVLNRIVQKYLVMSDITKKCQGVQRVYEFSCKSSELSTIKQTIDSQFPACKSTCPPSPTGQ